jgi:hypothetical protein
MTFGSFIPYTAVHLRLFATAKNSYNITVAASSGGSIQDWLRLFRRSYTHLTPGGWIEVQEHAIQIYSEYGPEHVPGVLKKWLSEMDRASRMVGKVMNVAEGLREQMINAGFEDVQEDIYKVSRVEEYTT